MPHWAGTGYHGAKGPRGLCPICHTSGMGTGKHFLLILNHLNQIHFEFDLNVDDVSLKSVRVASTLPGPHDYRSVWWLSRLLIMWELVACAKSVRNVTSRRSHIHMSERCIGSPVPYEATVQPARGTYPARGEILVRGGARMAIQSTFPQG